MLDKAQPASVTGIIADIFVIIWKSHLDHLFLVDPMGERKYIDPVIQPEQPQCSEIRVIQFAAGWPFFF